MKHLFHIVCFISGCLFFIGCTPEPLDIELPQEEPRLVIASQIIPQSVMIVTVSRSFGSLEYGEEDDNDSAQASLLEQILVDRCLVTVAYEGAEDTLFRVAPGFYTSVTTPQFVNVEYTLTVLDSNTGEWVTSQATMLEQVKFDTVTASRRIASGVEIVDIEIAFDDLEGQNWYMVNLYTSEHIGTVSPFGFDTDNSDLQLLSDQVYPSSRITETFNVFEWEEDTIVVAISNISKEYFEYLTLRQKSADSPGTFLSEPVKYPTNVSGGYGYFTTHFPDIKIVAVKD